MNRLKLVSLASLLAGAGLLGAAAIAGDVSFMLVLFVVPVVQGTGAAAALGMLLLVAATILWAMGSIEQMRGRAPGGLARTGTDTDTGTDVDAGADADTVTDEGPRRRSGGFVLLGPIPIVWGDARSRRWMVLAGGVLLAAWVLAVLWLGR